MSNTLLSGLPAQVNADCRVLILGSMPGAVSLRQASYYAHPRNRFWPLMAVLCGFDPQAAYPERMAMVQECGVGVWDVIGHCQRRGSLDAAIVSSSIVANPLPALIEQLPQLQAVICNGAGAAQAFKRLIQPQLSGRPAPLPVLAMPSTSPANAAYSLPRLLQEWEVVRTWLRPR